jgi:hypothetical protein
MLPNLRNELLEVIAVMFLAARSDVSQLRRCTSEANEHTYGHLRQILREFSVEQLIRLVDKVMLKTNAIFFERFGHLQGQQWQGLHCNLWRFFAKPSVCHSKDASLWARGC